MPYAATSPAYDSSPPVAGGLVALLADQILSPPLCHHGNKEYYEDKNKAENLGNAKRRVVIHGNLDIALWALGRIHVHSLPRSAN